jgi:hypothetical protein
LRRLPLPRSRSTLNAVPLQQPTSSLGNYVPLAGNVTVTGPLTMGTAATLTLNANAASALQAVAAEQLQAATVSYLQLSGGTMTGALTLAANAAAALQP